MKLRIRNDTLRYRLTQSEVARLAREGAVEGRTDFGAAAFVYALEVDEQAARASAAFSPQSGRMVVRLPRRSVARWAEGDDVGIEVGIALEGDKTLAVLVEKDFACLKPRAPEEDEGAFPNPAAQHAPDCGAEESS